MASVSPQWIESGVEDSLVRDQLEALEELARIDLGFRQLDVAQGEIDAHLTDLRSDVERIRDLLNREKVQLTEAEQLKSSTAREIEDIAERVTRSSNRHNVAKNNRERDATSREMEVLRREREERVAKVAELDTVVKQVRESLARHEDDFAKLQTVLANEETDGTRKGQEINVRRGAQEDLRKGVLGKVRPDLLRKYNIIRDRKGTAVAEISSAGICRGCNISIPPQLFVGSSRVDLQACKLEYSIVSPK